MTKPEGKFLNALRFYEREDGFVSASWSRPGDTFIRGDSAGIMLAALKDAAFSVETQLRLAESRVLARLVHDVEALKEARE